MPTAAKASISSASRSTDARALDALGARLEAHGVEVARGARALADERFVKDLIVFSDPVGNRIEVFHGAEVAPTRSCPGAPFQAFAPARSAWATSCSPPRDVDELVAVLSRRPRLPAQRLFRQAGDGHFFHLNPRHHTPRHSGDGKNGIHHMMVEVNFLDDVGQGYDIAQLTPDLVGADASAGTSTTT